MLSVCAAPPDTSPTPVALRRDAGHAGHVLVVWCPEREEGWRRRAGLFNGRGGPEARNDRRRYTARARAYGSGHDPGAKRTSGISSANLRTNSPNSELAMANHGRVNCDGSSFA